MNRSEKEAVVKDVAERVSRAKAIILTDYNGLKVEQMTELRQQLTSKNLDLVVIKNRLVKRAVEGTDAEALTDLLTGPNGFGFSYEDPVDLAKVLVDFAKDNPALEIKGGILEGKRLEASTVSSLAKLPPREQLLAMLLGVMNGVPRNLVSVLAATVRGLLNALKAIEEQKAQEAA